MSNLQFPLKKLEIPGLAVAPEATGDSTSVESSLQIDPFYAKQSQSFDSAQDRFAGWGPEIRNSKSKIRNNEMKQNMKKQSQFLAPRDALGVQKTHKKAGTRLGVK